MEKILISFFVFFLVAAVPLNCASKEELASIERQAREKEAQLKKYKAREAALSNELKALTQKQKKTEQLAVKISNDIEGMQTKSSMIRRHKEVVENNLPLWQNIMKAEFSNYAVERMLGESYYNSSELLRALALSSTLKTHAVFMQKLSSEIDKTQKEIDGFKEKHSSLLAERDKLEEEKSALLGSYEKKKEDLQEAHALYEKANKDLKELKASAAQLQKILKEAEAKRKAEQKKAGQKQTGAALNISKNSLPWPVSGKIISKFGKEYQAQLKTWIFRDGIKISAAKGAPIVSVAEGKVIFAGEFRSYGNVVIVDHGGGFFTIYGFLSEIRASLDKQVNKGQIIGLCGADTQGSAMGSGQNALYFEVRSGTSAVDPELWLEKK
ncbi:MAG: murein hydrolase activator EnvC family protein [Elusimicrobiaceae bacterium]